ncbi:MAG: zf-HC2 domain-containing protein [bacterium]|nr:zf-HC2 domain-containing protein [bacterium]
MMFSCKYIEKHLSAFIDDELNDSRRKKIASHLSGCSNCAQQLEEIRSNNLLIGQIFSDKKIAGAEKSKKDFSAVMRYIYDRDLNEPEEEKITTIESFKEMAAERVNSLVNLLRFSGSDMDIETSLAGEAVSGGIGKLIPALLIGLAILLFYAPKLNALISMMNYS